MTNSNILTAFPTFACPVCSGQLVHTYESEKLSCLSCCVKYPILNRLSPVLMESPDAYLRGEKEALEREASQHHSIAEYYLNKAAETTIRRKVLRQLAAGLRLNGSLLQAMSAVLPSNFGEMPVKTGALGGDLFACLRKDWGGSEETEQELRLAQQAIFSRLEPLCPESTLVLGAGLGRLLCEIDARFPVAIGLDISSAMAIAFGKLCQQNELQGYLLHQGNFLRGEDECERIVARRQLASGSPSYVIANAGQLPFPDATFDAVISNYFTDMLPLSQWLPEAKRVLKPAGKLIHFGPLGYVFSQIDEHYAVDQLSEAFGVHGFVITPPVLIRNTFYASNRRLNRFELDNLLFTASHAEPTTP